MKKNIKKIGSFLFLSVFLMSLFFNSVNAFSNGDSIVKIRLFKAPKTGYKRLITKYTVSNPNKSIIVKIKANPLSKNVEPYWEFRLIKLKNEIGSNFNSYFSKDLITKGGVSYLGKSFGGLERASFKKLKEEDIREYGSTVSYKNLNDGINYFTVCGLDSNFINIKGKNVFKCSPVKTFYFNQSSNQIVDKDTFEELYENYKNKEKQKIETTLQKINSYFDENKLKKSRYGKNTKIKTHQELQKLILSKLKKSDLELIKKELNTKELQKNRFLPLKINSYSKTIASQVLNVDDNGLVLGSFRPQFPIYVKGTILKYLNGQLDLNGESKEKKEENKEENQNKKQNKENVNNQNNNGECGQISLLKKENEINRSKAIDFSKKLLGILNKYPSKQKKLEAIDYLFNLLNTTYGPDNYENQDLIGYVKDYLAIVQYAVEIEE